MVLSGGGDQVVKGLRWIFGRSNLARARRAARVGEWVEAQRQYRQHLSRYADDRAAWVQLGHVLKEQGCYHDAVTAYRQAVTLQPQDVAAWIFMAHTMRGAFGPRDAIATLLEAMAQGNSASMELVDEVIAMGARDQLAFDVQAVVERRDRAYSLARYGRYLADLDGLRAPSAERSALAILAVVDARGADLGSVDTTGLGLDMVFPVVDPPCLGSGADRDVTWAGAAHLSSEDRIADLPSDISHILVARPGCRIDRNGIAQLYDAISRTNAGAAYGDHDIWRLERDGITRSSPCFQPMHDPFWFSSPDISPPCIMVARSCLDPDMRWETLFDTSMSLPLTYAHMPFILASASGEATKPLRSAVFAPPPDPCRIQVIIQTRDAPKMLDRCVGSLLKTASAPQLLDIVIVDNRSVLPETAALLQGWTAHGVVRVVSHDEPFNWARANNLAVNHDGAPLLLFLNNDVEMTSLGWDISLRAYLADANVGAVGALLLYPDGMIQHAGIIVGMDGAGPIHEGVGQPPDSGGPNGRWTRTRLASAVTGAWLATTTEVFDAVGGFDESFPVSFNDVDFCLRCRAAQRYVVQVPDIRAVHHESVTRGKNLSRAAALKEDADLARLIARWGDALDLDPAYNPHWVRKGVPFDGFTSPSEPMVARWVAASALPRPWAIAPSVLGQRPGCDEGREELVDDADQL